MYYEMFVLRNHENYFSEKNRASTVKWVVVSEFNSADACSSLCAGEFPRAEAV
jgi:hypothetical protein